MIRKETHKLASAYKGTVQAVMSAGLGTPCADPSLQVIYTEGFAPEGLDVVSNVGVAVGINDKGYLAPCDGTIIPYGIVADSLLGTACMFDGDNDISAMGGFTGTESLHQRIPTVYQAGTLFEVGMCYKTDGTKKEIFELKVGDLLRPITKEEIESAINDGTLPKPKLPGKGQNLVELTVEQAKAFYAGMLVKFDPEKDCKNLEQKCARVAAIIDPAVYENYAYTSQFAFDYDVQGAKTNGHSRGVWNVIGAKHKDDGYKKMIVQFYVTM